LIINTHEDSMMIGKPIRAAAMAGAFATLCFAAPANAAPYDGAWKMSLVTTDGHCGVINVGLAIHGGRITSTSGKFVMRPIHIAGLVTGSGQARMNGVAGPRKAAGTGHFSRAGGRGKWNGVGPSGVCSGYWVATRG
jgi:hypothetical protein